MPDHGASLLRLSSANAHERLGEDGRRAIAMAADGHPRVIEKAGAAAATIAVARVDHSDDVTYEIVNFIDGARSVGEIRDAVSAEFEPIELNAVAEYLDLLAKAGAVRFKP
jgi:hypothetical protein